MSSATVSDVNWYPAAIAAIKKRAMQGLIMMGADIANRSRYLAPYKTGNLKASIRVVPNDAEYAVYVTAGGLGGVDYALIREYHNNLHPATKFYMRNGAREILNGNWMKYFGEVSG